MLYTAVKLSLQWIRFKQTGFTANQLFTVRPWMAKHTLKQWSADISASGYRNKIIFGSTIVIIVHSRTQSRKKRPRLAAKQVKWAHQTLVTAWTWIRQNQTNTFGHKIQLTLPHQPLPDPNIIHGGNKSDLREEQQQSSQRYLITTTRSLQKGKLFYVACKPHTDLPANSHVM